MAKAAERGGQRKAAVWPEERLLHARLLVATTAQCLCTVGVGAIADRHSSEAIDRASAIRERTPLSSCVAALHGHVKRREWGQLDTVRGAGRAAEDATGLQCVSLRLILILVSLPGFDGPVVAAQAAQAVRPRL